MSYQPGELKAIGYIGKKKVATAQLRSASAPSQIRLGPDKTTLVSDGQSLSYITVELLDANGTEGLLASEVIIKVVSNK